MLQTFPRSARLTKTGEFSSVFSFKRSFKGKFLSLYYLFHEKSEKIFDISARLGIVIAKKMLKKSVDRNRCKRILRDIFRLHRYELTNFGQVDIILRLNYKNITQLTNYNQLLRQDFLYLFSRLKNLKKSKSPTNKDKHK